MSKFKQCIHIEGNCIEDIFRLPYCTSISKIGDSIYYFIENKYAARIGDWICEDYNGVIHILSNDEYNRRNL